MTLWDEKSRKKSSRMAGRAAGKSVLAPEVGRTCAKALSQEGKDEFGENNKKKNHVGLIGLAKAFKCDL